MWAGNVTNIDKEGPEIEAPTSAVAGNSVSVTLKDIGSGLAGWLYSTSSTKPTSTSSGWTSVTGTSATVSFTPEFHTSNTNAIYYVFAKDALGNVSEASISAQGAIWQNTNTGVYYDATYKAFENAADGETVKLVNNCTVKTQPMVTGDKSITADIGSYLMTVEVGPINIESGSTLTITGSGTINYTDDGTGSRMFLNMGTLNITSGTITANGGGICSSYGAFNMSGGTITHTTNRSRSG